MHAMNDPDVYVSLEELKLVLCALPQNNKRPKYSFLQQIKLASRYQISYKQSLFRFVNLLILRSPQITSCHRVCS